MNSASAAAPSSPSSLASTINKLLSPWRFRKGKLLSGDLLQPCSCEPLDETLWCEWDQFEEDWETIVKSVECFELLRLVAHIDTAIFRGVASELFTSCVEDQWDSTYTRIGILIDVHDLTGLPELALMFGWENEGETTRLGDDRSNPTPQFQAAKDELHRLVQEHGQIPLEPMAVRLRVPGKSLGEAHAVAKRQHDRGPDATSRLAFKLTHVDFGLHTSLITDDNVWRAMQFEALGVDVARLELSGRQIPKALDPLLWFQLMEMLVRPRSSMRSGQVVSRGINHLAFLMSIDRRLHLALCTALMCSDSVQMVSAATFFTDRTREETRALWQALAFALFSSVSTHRVEILSLQAEQLTEEDVAIVESVVRHDNPLVPGLDPHVVSVDNPSTCTVDVQAGSGVWLQGEVGEVEPRSFALPTDQRNLMVLRDNGDPSISVLLPGCGPCWVNRASITDSTGPMSVHTSQPRQAKAIRHVMLRDATPKTSGPCLNFLKVIGVGIEHLDISAFKLSASKLKSALPSEWLRDAMTACPNLHKLSISGTKIDGVEPILDACESGALRLSALTIEMCPIRGELTSFFRLFDALSDASHPLAKTLKHLTLTATSLNPAQKASWDLLLEAWVAMLSKNRVLALSRWQSFGLASRRKHLEAQFARFDGQVTSGREGPVQLRSKLAFLSTLSVNRVDLASDVLSTIFKFAAPHETRRSQYHTGVSRVNTREILG